MRNPRRAYDESGRELKPETVANHMVQGLKQIEIFCQDCNHYRAGIDITGLPPDTALPDICLRYICSQCGSKNLLSRADTHEFYAVQQARTRLR